MKVSRRIASVDVTTAQLLLCKDHVTTTVKAVQARE